MPAKNSGRAPWFAVSCALTGLWMAEAVGAAPAMKLSPDLTQVSAAPVRGRAAQLWQGGIEFADWRASTPAPFDIKNWSWDVPLGDSHANEALRVDVAKVGFEYQLSSPASSTANRCLAQGRFAVHTEYRGRVTDETAMTLPGYPRIDCKLSHRGLMSLRPDFLTQRDSGLVQFGERIWSVQSVNNLASQRSSFPLGRFGYEFRAGGAVVAAVETAGKGRAWFSPALAADEREELAAAMSALLYYGTILEEQDP